MITEYKCGNCGVAASVRSDPNDLMIGGRLHSETNCPQCDRKMSKITLERDSDPNAISVDEFMFFQARLARPGEVVTQRDVVTAMLLAHKIVKVDATNINDRCVINKVLLDNGVWLYFASSGLGAVIWRVAKDKEGEDASNREI